MRLVTTELVVRDHTAKLPPAPFLVLLLAPFLGVCSRPCPHQQKALLPCRPCQQLSSLGASGIPGKMTDTCSQHALKALGYTDGQVAVPWDRGEPQTDTPPPCCEAGSYDDLCFLLSLLECQLHEGRDLASCSRWYPKHSEACWW